MHDAIAITLEIVAEWMGQFRVAAASAALQGKS
jgi:hypothetical protein